MAIRSSTLTFYAAPLVPVWMLHTPALSILPGLYVTVSGIDLATVAVILLISRLFDGFSDPLIGMLSDRTRSSLGRRKPWIIAGALLSMLGVWFWFRPGPDTGALYFLLSSLLVYTGWTMIEIPHSAWLSELADGYHERSRAAGYRSTAIYLGHVVFWLGPFLPLFATTEITPDVTAFLSWVVIVMLMVLVPLAMTRVPSSPATVRAAIDVRSTVTALIRNKPLKLFVALLTCNWLASGSVAGLYFFYVSHFLQIPEKFGHVGLLVALIGFVSAIFWGKAGAIIGKHRMLAICNFSVVCTLLAMALIRPGPWAFAGLMTIFGLSALFTAGASVAHYALMADIVDYDELKTGSNKAGSHYSLLTLIQKAGIGMGAAMGMLIATGFGFDPSGPNGLLATAGFFTGFLGIPIVLNLVSTLLALVFPLTEHRHAVIRKRLDQIAARRHEIADAPCPSGTGYVNG